MASRSVDFIFRLIDAFTPNAKQLEAAAKRSQAALDAMGQASNRLDKALASIKPPPLPQMAQGFDQVAKSANTAATAVANAQKRMNAGSWASTYQSWRAENAKIDREAAAWAAKQEAGHKKTGVGGMFGIGGSKLMDAYIGFHMARGAAQGVDHVVSRVGDVEAMRTKMALALGGNQAQADAAVQKAMELSGKYRNTSVLENLHVIDDLRANLPESFDKILGEVADPFVKMHAFFKAWEGGKHTGKAEGALRDISAAIRAGELTGNMTADLLKQHTMALSAAKVVFGEKFKIQEYFQATQKAATALSAADKTFQYVDFPVMIQRLSQGGGVALATMFAKESGIRMPAASVEMWRKLGLTDEDEMQRNKVFDKHGKVRAGGLTGTRWLKNAEQWSTNLTDAVMMNLAPALEQAAKEGKLGKDNKLANLPGKELAKAWQEKNVEKLAHLLEDFRKGAGNMAALSAAMNALGYDRNASKALEEALVGAASIMRDRGRVAELLGVDLQAIETYAKKKQELSAQADRALQAWTGKDWLGNANAALDKMSEFLGWVADKGQSARAVLMGQALGFPGYRDASGFHFDAGLNLGSGALAGRAYMDQSLAEARAAQTAASPFNYFQRVPEAPTQSWAQWWKGETPSAFPPDSFNRATGAQPGPEQPQSGMLGGLSAMAGNIPQGEAMREITVKTTIDPIRVEVPPSVAVDVRVTGTVNGSVEGSGKGSISMKAEAPRGESSPAGK